MKHLNTINTCSHHQLSRLWLLLGCLSVTAACSVTTESDEPRAELGETEQKVRAIKEGPVQAAPVPAPAEDNPFAGAQLFVDPQSLAALAAKNLKEEHPDQAQVIERIAQQPMALWMGEWNSDIYRAVDHFVTRAEEKNQLPVMIAYNIPHRDCAQYSGGGLESKEAYQKWIRLVQAGIGDRPAAVILEPDALGHFQECLNDKKRAERMSLLGDAVQVLRQGRNTAVYLDAGHARWVKAEEMAPRLQAAGLAHAHGFALNTSNYVSTEENLKYGRELSALAGDKPFVIDTSRNGAGPYEEASNAEETWCNPPGRKIGPLPTSETADPLCHAYLWLKRPGESDGECGGGPRAGVFWLKRALEMASLD